MAFKTSPQCGHVAAVEETGCLQVGQLVSVAILVPPSRCWDCWGNITKNTSQFEKRLMNEAAANLMAVSRSKT